ncbi:hypothetical protein TL16_g06807 [Triparma laevis f. inornata]|uniref:Cation/H+ exchanger transmembrane domain-containing protein n=1 Tax=Triparma laevis f. inornata TaxID=1714386 RepID=A0A9W7ARZ8_9STRA|nr:hypothetical protein TL16_g06807 [Triparma laevis f. inornata]
MRAYFSFFLLLLHVSPTLSAPLPQNSNTPNTRSDSQVHVLINPPPSTAVCLTVLDKYIHNLNETASNECSALQLAYRGAHCDVIEHPDLPGPDLTDDFGPNYDNDDDNSDDDEKRICCENIKNTYHQRCDDDANGVLSDQRLVVTLMCIVFCLFIKELIRMNEITLLPEAAGCILVGLFGGFILQFIPHFIFEFDEKLFLRVLLPPICFEAALSINKDTFRKHIGPILAYACAGTVMSSAIVGLMMKYGSMMTDVGGGEGLPWAECLAFGALISSVDPVAVIAVMNSLGVSPTEPLYVMIFGEALLNDGVAVVLFDTVVDFFKEDVEVDQSDFVYAFLNFIKVFFGSAAIGFVQGLLMTFYFRWMDKKMGALVETLQFFLSALLTYYICDSWGGSGICGIVVTGVMADIYTMQHLSEGAWVWGGRRAKRSSRKHVHFVVETVATLMETVIFAYLGLFLFISNYRYNFLLILISITAMLFSRGVMLAFIGVLINKMECCKCAWRVRQRGSRNVDNVGGDDGHGNIHAGADLAGGGTDDSVTSSASLYENDKDKYESTGLFVTKSTQFILWFSGLRGGMTFALVENIPVYDPITKMGSHYKPELRACASACIFLSIFVFGGLTNYILGKMGVGRNGGGGSTGEGTGLRLSDVLSTHWGRRKYEDDGEEVRSCEEEAQVRLGG